MTEIEKKFMSIISAITLIGLAIAAILAEIIIP